MKELLLNVLAFVVTAGIIGILAHILGEKLPRAKFDPEKFPYAPYAWEKYGRVYERLGIAKWKDKMPDKSKFAFAQNKTVRKSVGGDVSGAHFELLFGFLAGNIKNFLRFSEIRADLQQQR